MSTIQEKATVAKAPRGRVRRTPVGVRGRLNVRNKDPNFHYRVVSDEAGRVDQFLDAGYEIVTGKETIGDSRLNQPSQEGSPVQTHVGGGVKGVLMRIPNEWYTEDQEAKQAFVNEKEAAITDVEGKYGNVDSRYGT